jgi:hypothetical protein
MVVPTILFLSTWRLYDLLLPANVMISLFVGCSGENWQPNMILDDGGDATHVMVKKYPAVFKLL